MRARRQGPLIQVTGRLKENTWIDKQTGQKRSRIKVSVLLRVRRPATAARGPPRAIPTASSRTRISSSRTATRGGPGRGRRRRSCMVAAGGEKHDLW